MDLWSQLTGGAAHSGSWGGLPDLGITEAVGGLLGSQRSSQGGSDIIPNATAPAQAPQPGQVLPASTQNRSTVPTAPTGGGGGLPSGTKTTPTTPTYNVNDEAAKRAAQLAGQNSDQQAKLKEAIGGAYDPIFSELDRQIGLTPQYKQQLSDQISTLAGQQTTDVTSQQTQDINSINTGKATEVTNAKGSLRNLEEDVRNIIQATALYLGSRGAGDSSAGGAASEAITSAAQKARSGVLQTRDQALGVLDSKIADVNAAATDQIRKIGDWKTNKLADITQWAIDRVDQLNQQKSTASGAKANAIANMITQTEQQFYSALKGLDDAVFNYNQSVATWQQQRQADLEDFKTKLGIQASYTNTSPAQYKVVTDAFGRTFAVNPTNPSQVVDISGNLGTATGTTKKPDQQSLGLGSALGIGTPTIQ